MLLSALCVLPVAARADSFDPISFGVHASTLGYGITLERPLLFDLSARIATGLLSTSSAQNVDGYPWESTFHENNVLVALDWRPYAGRWRLSGGLLLRRRLTSKTSRRVVGPNYQLNGNALSGQPRGCRFGAHLVRAAGDLPRRRRRYRHPQGLTIAFDAGIVIRNGQLSTSATGPLQGNAQFQNDLNATASQFRTRFIQPVIGVGLVYRP